MPIGSDPPPDDPTHARTLLGVSPAADATISDAGPPSPAEPGPQRPVPGYALGVSIGVGGMGEVVAAYDEDIGREVAIKRLRSTATSGDSVVRFLREARIQARLEHPAIVPVHELGRDPDGQPYFTMKRLTGKTLARLLEEPIAPARQRLLRAFVDICKAIEFAHARGVVHRDLKPANIMLGDFGEVYVLDWGLARVLGEHDATIGVDVESLDGQTQAGAVLGTPGYMAPEQAKGGRDVTPAADIYALGTILFEILAGERLHPPGIGALATTIDGIDGSPARRKPDRGVPPELDATCVAALERDPAARPSARALAQQIERYLDGDRDIERRRELAAAQIAVARAGVAAADPAKRAEAARAAGRALALDPDSREAAGLIAAYLLQPPDVLPAELRAEMMAEEGRVQRRQSRTALGSFVGIIVYVVVAAWNGLHSIALLVAIGALTSLLALAQWQLQRRTATTREMICIAVGNTFLAALMSRVFGPLIVAPAVCCVMAVSLSSYPQLIDRARIVVPLLILSWIGPVVLEWAGVLRPTWHVGHGVVTSTSHMLEIGGTSTEVLLVVAHVIAIAVIALFANALAKSRRDAQRQVETQLWQLRQLVPAPT